MTLANYIVNLAARDYIVTFKKYREDIITVQVNYGNLTSNRALDTELLSRAYFSEDIVKANVQLAVEDINELLS